MPTPLFLSSRSARAALLTTVVLLAGCGSDPASDPSSAPDAADQAQGAVELSADNQQACDQAREVTSSYTSALQGATNAEQARVVVDDAVAGLRDIDGEPPVGARVDDVADALDGLLAAVDGGSSPEELRPVAEQIGQATEALAADCGIEPETDPEQEGEPETDPEQG